MDEKKEVHPTTGRPVLHNPDKSISTEETITVQVEELNKGRHTNIPTIVEGKRVSDRYAIEHAIKNQEKNKYPHYNSEKDAVRAAVERSKQLGKDYQEHKAKKQER